MENETLTFGELPIGQKFIVLPQPGDNNGHGGLKGIHYIFKKMSNGTGTRLKGNSSTFPSDMEIIHIAD